MHACSLLGCSLYLLDTILSAIIPILAAACSLSCSLRLTSPPCLFATSSARHYVCVRFFLAKRSFLLACLFFTGKE